LLIIIAGLGPVWFFFVVVEKRIIIANGEAKQGTRKDNLRLPEGKAVP
jgi:hypothetical protein